MCFNCLRHCHLSNKCLKTKGCYYCKGIHNSVICNKPEEKEVIKTASNLSSANKEMTLIQTAEVYVVNKRNNKKIKLKVLFDSGSEKSFLSQRAYTCLQLLAICTDNLKRNTFGNENSQNSSAKKVIFQLKTTANKSVETKACVTLLICLPIKNQPLNLAKKHFEKYNVNFADQGHLGDEIDLLIGMDTYWTFMTGKVQQLHEFRNLVMQESVFGWILSGSLN